MAGEFLGFFTEEGFITSPLELVESEYFSFGQYIRPNLCNKPTINRKIYHVRKEIRKSNIPLFLFLDQ